jgi:hypothetical protein
MHNPHLRTQTLAMQPVFTMPHSVSSKNKKINKNWDRIRCETCLKKISLNYIFASDAGRAPYCNN